MTLKKLWLLSIFAIFAVINLPAQKLEIFEKDNELPTLKWQRVIGENLIREKIIAALTPLTKDQRFNVYVSIRLKSIKARQKPGQDIEDRNQDDVVDLGKLGQAAPAISDEQISKGTLWAQVEYIKTEVVLYDHAPDEQLKMMDSITRKIIYAVVPAWRAGITVAAPRFDLVNYMFDRKILIGIGIATAFFLFLSALLLLNFFYSRQQRSDEERVSFVNVAPGFREWISPSREAREVAASREMANVSLLDMTQNFPEANVSMDSNEWRKMIEADPTIGAVLANILPSEAAARVFAGLPVDLVKRTTDAALGMTEHDVKTKTSDLQKLMSSMANRKTGASFLSHAVDLVGRVGPSREMVFFNSLTQAGRLDLLEQAARKHFPAHLMLGLPADLLRMLVNTLRAEERIELALAVDMKDRGQILEAIGPAGSKLREYSEMQIQIYENDTVRMSEIKNRAGYIWWDFVKLVRRTLNSDHELVRKTDLFLNAWLDEQRKKAPKGKRDGQAA